MAKAIKPYEYFAFISYKREDEKWAKWLQKKLESYSLPTSIRKKNPELPNKIRPVFRDQSELSGGNLKAEIEKGLNGAKYLIVICSPRSAKSTWVSKEVQHFIDQGREEYIIPFIVGGTPNASNLEDECFPEGLRQLTGEKEILGININEMGRDAATIKVIARMFDLRFDSLWQRHEKAKRKRRLWTGLCAVILVAISLSIAGYIAHQNTLIIAERDRANNERDRAERANNNLSIANDSISNNLRHIKIINDSLDKTNNLLINTIAELNLTNVLLKEEKELVIQSNWELLKKHAKSVATLSKIEIEKGNIYQAILALLTVIPKDNEMPYVAEVENSLRIAYEKLNLGGWFHTVIDGYYETLKLSKDCKYIFLINNNAVDVYDSNNYTFIQSTSIDDLNLVELGMETDERLIQNYDSFSNIIAVSNDSKYVLRQNIEYTDDEDGDYYSYSLIDRMKNEIVRIDNNGKFYNPIAGFNEIVSVSFSPNATQVILSFRDGHVELINCSNGKSLFQWKCDNCDHYSNWNAFGNNQFVLHTSRFERGIIIYDSNNGERVDSIPCITGGEIFGAKSNTSLDKIWLLEENVPIAHIKIEKFEPRDRYDGFHEIEFHPKKKLTTKRGVHIVDNNDVIECFDSKNRKIWEYSSHYGCNIMSLFDDNRIVIVQNSQRFYDDYIFINIETGQVVYQISDFNNIFIGEDDASLIFSQTHYTPEENSAHMVLPYSILIEVCKKIVKNKNISQLSKNLFNI